MPRKPKQPKVEIIDYGCLVPFYGGWVEIGPKDNPRFAARILQDFTEHGQGYFENHRFLDDAQQIIRNLLKKPQDEAFQLAVSAVGKMDTAAMFGDALVAKICSENTSPNKPTMTLRFEHRILSSADKREYFNSAEDATKPFCYLWLIAFYAGIEMSWCPLHKRCNINKQCPDCLNSNRVKRHRDQGKRAV
ncbi:hypothetical protein ACFLU6_09740 [Acidobacteriota bacterium]